MAILFLYRPGAHQLQKRITNSLSSALGRRVDIDGVRVHLLPRPGFDLDGLVIWDDPEFSAEPMVRAQEVAARIRLSSLLRGRLEIATLSANEPSINLVRNQGRWNLAGLLARSASIAAAPTGKTASERRPGFPYLEASHARINLKLGQEKKPFALTEAEVALWQESENSWGARLRAQPIRTDFNLTDTGLIRFNAIWQRAPTLSETPLSATVQWTNGQLGQMTKLISGRDRGWRGGIEFTANLTGTPEALQIQSRTTVDNFHRYDIVGSENLLLAADCSVRYSTAGNRLRDLLCQAPVDEGVVRLRGTLGGTAAGADYDLNLAVERVPFSSVLRWLRQAKRGLPEDLTAGGVLDANVRAQRTAALTRWSGEGVITRVRVALDGGKDEILVADVPLLVQSPAAKPVKTVRQNRAGNSDTPAETHLRIGPVPLAVGGAAPATAEGWLTSTRYQFALRGDAEVREVLRLADLVGVPGMRPAAQGAAKVDLNVTGAWHGFGAPTALGTAQLHNVRVELRGLNKPIEFAAAKVVLNPEAASLEIISAQIAGTHWTGSVSAPRPCVAPGCVFGLHLAADQLSTGDLAEWFTRQPASRPWYRILSPADREGRSPLAGIEARGDVRIGRFSLKKVVATQLAAQIALDRGQITLTDLRAQLLQGTHQGNWVIDTAAFPPRYQGAGSFQNVSLAAISTAMGEAWATGSVDAQYRVATAGASFGELLSRAEGDVQFAARNGSFPHVELPGSAMPLTLHRFEGDLRLKTGTWELGSAKLECHDGIYQVTGTASSARGLSFILTRNDEQVWTVSGTLAKPQVRAGNRTVAGSQ